MSARHRKRKAREHGKRKGRRSSFKPKCEKEINSHTYSNGHGETWKVDRLHRLSKGLTPYKMPLGYFTRELDEWPWGQDLTLNGFIDHLKRAVDADLNWPIILSAEGDVMDGRHRLVRSAYLNLEWIWVVRFPVTPEPD
jgi:hypothetical protein